MQYCIIRFYSVFGYFLKACSHYAGAETVVLSQNDVGMLGLLAASSVQFSCGDMFPKFYN